MKQRIVIGLLLFLLTPVLRAEVKPVTDLVKRLLPGYETQFEFNVDSTANEDFFELRSHKGKIVITGNRPVSVSFGLNWYLKYYCHCNLSFCGNQKRLPEKLPAVTKTVRKSTHLTHNYYLNYCTFSYTTAFWDWKRWEYEIDLMALNGVTEPLAMVGAEAVWRNTLRQFNYTDKEIKNFLCGPAYFAWFLMGNLEQIGGPLPDEWFDRQINLQNKILQRMHSYGMKPVFQAFYGMVPNNLKEKYPQAQVLEQGDWSGLKRPVILLSNDTLFKQMANVWYKEYEKLFGRNDYFAGDLFHEGGKTNGLNIKELARGVQQTMLDYNPNAQWYIQAWGANPREELLAGLNKKHTVIIDLAAEFWERWKERKGFDGFPWLWDHITNYGGNIGLHGRLDAIAEGPLAAEKDPYASKSMIGTGSAPEGIEVNPVVFDLANEMRWRKDPVDLPDWLAAYTQRRYGIKQQNLIDAWNIFYRTAYGTYPEHRRPSESVFCALPSLLGKDIHASVSGRCKIYYNPNAFAKGVSQFLKSASLSREETYRYDVTDLVRQYISNLGRETYYQLVKAYENKDLNTFKKLKTQFLQLLTDQDELLSSHPYFHVSRWLNGAKAASTNPVNQKLYEYNARQLIGTWTEHESNLRDYAHKEWGGMLKDYYYPRWNTYLTYLENKLEGKNVQAPDLYRAERAWITSQNTYKYIQKDCYNIAKRLFYKYYTQSNLLKNSHYEN